MNVQSYQYDHTAGAAYIQTAVLPSSSAETTLVPSERAKVRHNRLTLAGSGQHPQRRPWMAPRRLKTTLA
eukprot:4113005-Pleurochrysis_carterae.AAC.3